MSEQASMVKVYKPKTKIEIPPEMLAEVEKYPEGSSQRHKAEANIAAFVSGKLTEMSMEEIDPGKPKHISTSKLPLNTRDKPIGRKDWLHKK